MVGPYEEMVAGTCLFEGLLVPEVIKTNDRKLLDPKFCFPDNLTTLSPLCPDQFTKLCFSATVLQQETDGTLYSMSIAHENFVFDNKMKANRLDYVRRNDGGVKRLSDEVVELLHATGRYLIESCVAADNHDATMMARVGGKYDKTQKKSNGFSVTKDCRLCITG
jgi:hypothetical protein